MMPRLLSAATALLVGLLAVVLIDLAVEAAGVLADVNRAQVTATGEFTQCEGCIKNTITLRFDDEGGPVTGEAHIRQPIPDWGECVRTIDANVLEEDSSYSADTGKLSGKARVREVIGGDPTSAYCGLASGDTTTTQDWSAIWKDDKVTGSGLGGGDFELRANRQGAADDEPGEEVEDEPGEEVEDEPDEEGANEPGEEGAEEPGAATEEDDEGVILGAARDAAEQLHDSGGRPSGRDLAIAGLGTATVLATAGTFVLGSPQVPRGWRDLFRPKATLDRLIKEQKRKVELALADQQKIGKDIERARSEVFDLTKKRAAFEKRIKQLEHMISQGDTGATVLGFAGAVVGLFFGLIGSLAGANLGTVAWIVGSDASNLRDLRATGLRALAKVRNDLDKAQEELNRLEQTMRDVSKKVRDARRRLTELKAERYIWYGRRP